MKEKVFSAIFLIVLALLPFQMTWGQELTVEFEQRITSTTPVFVPGQEADMTAIQGFSFESELLLDGRVVGAVSGQVTDLSGVFDPSKEKLDTKIEATLTFPGLGTIFGSGYGIGVTSTETLSTGEIVYAGAESLSGGDGDFTGLRGTYIWWGRTNYITGEGSFTGTMYLQVP